MSPIAPCEALAKCLLFGPERSLDERETQASSGLAVRRQLGDGVRVRHVVGQEHAFQPGNQLTEDLHPLWAEFDVQIGGPRDVAAGTGQTLHQSDPHRIAAAHEDDRDPIGRCLRGLRRVSPFGRHDDVDAAPNEITSGLGKLRWIALRKAHADHELLVFTISKLPQAVAQTNDRRRRPPGFCQSANLDQTRGRRPDSAPAELERKPTSSPPRAAVPRRRPSTTTPRSSVPWESASPSALSNDLPDIP